MLFLPESAYKELDRLAEKAYSGRMKAREAGEQIVGQCPEMFMAYPLLSQACMAEGDDAGAEAWLWKGLTQAPSEANVYFLLSIYRASKYPNDVIARRLLEMACWKLSVAEVVMPMIQDYFRDLAGAKPKLKLDYSRPDTFEILAGAMEMGRQQEEDNDPPDVVERLLPFRMLTDLERQAQEQVDSALLDEFRRHADRCVPVLHASLRGWARMQCGTEEAAAMVAAVLGEIGSTALIPDLLELSQRSDAMVFLHAHWAVFRLGQRFPEETLRALRSMIREADEGLRCAIAEQLALMPDLSGWVQAAGELLDGFAGFAQNSNAEYLLLSVVHELAARGHTGKAQDIERRYLPLLTRDARKWVQQARKDFLSRLVEEAIDDLTLEDVCVECLLMDDDENDEDYADEDDDRAPEPVRPARPGRNDPCWCGSGKKYKKCHLEGDEQSDRQPANATPEEPPVTPVNALTDSTVSELVPEVLNVIPRSAFTAAEQMYFEDDPESALADPETDGLFTQWLMFDFRLPNSGRTPVEEFLKRRAHNLSARYREQLEAWTRTRMALLEIQRVEEGHGVEVKDLLAGDEYFVNDISSSRSAVRWDCLLNRVEHVRGRWQFSGNGFLVARNILPGFLKWVEKERKKAKQTAADFVRDNSHRLHRIVRQLHADQLDALEAVNFEGHPIAFSKAVYRIRDKARVLEVLRGMEEFVENKPDAEDPAGHHFGWVATEESADGGRPSFGSIRVEEGELRLETNSEERLERGRRLLDLNVGDWLEHLSDDVESFAQMKHRVMSAGGDRPAPPTHTDEEREFVRQHKQQHYANWADEPLPALSGRTPREAVRTREGRKAVEDLLRLFENGEERGRKQGQESFDFSALRADLGLL